MNQATINDLVNQAKELLNPSAFSINSIEGVLVICLIAYMIYRLSEKAFKFVAWCFAAIFLLQLGHQLSYTSVNNYINLRACPLFQYDILTSIAQLFVNTPICDWLLYANEMIKQICEGIASTLTQYLH